MGNALRAENAVVIIGETGEYLIRLTVDQTDECNPLLLVVLEAHDIGFKFDRAFHHMGIVNLDFLSRLFLLFLNRDKHTGTRPVAIDSTSLAAGAPCLHIEAVDKLLGDIGREVDGDRDRMVDPFLHPTLHLHFLKPVDIG